MSAKVYKNPDSKAISNAEFKDHVARADQFFAHLGSEATRVALGFENTYLIVTEEGEAWWTEFVLEPGEQPGTLRKVTDSEGAPLKIDKAQQLPEGVTPEQYGLVGEPI